MPTKKDPRVPKDKERFEILLEDIQDNVQLLAERQKMQGDRLETKMEEGFKEQNRQRELGQRALTKRIDGVEASLTKRIDEVETSLNKKIDGVEASLTKRIDEVESSLTKKIDGVETSLTKEIQEKVLPRLEDHEQRITALEEKPAA